MLEAITAPAGARGSRSAALTNNWMSGGGGDARAPAVASTSSSSRPWSGCGNPIPRIYQLVCRELGVAPAEAVFLDDIGGNLKAARELGMTTIKVDEPDAALHELEGVLGIALR